MKSLLRFFSSLELTIGCMAMAMVLIFFGTIDQKYIGIHAASEKYFYAVFVTRDVPSLGITLPFLPGGYLIGFILLINLICSAFYRFRFSAKKLGIWFIHMGVILLLIGEFVSSVFQVEAAMTIDEGQTVNYTERYRETELAIMDTTSPDKDRVYAVPETMLARRQQIAVPELPFKVSVDDYMQNSALRRRSGNMGNGARMATQGLGREFMAIPLAPTSDPDRRDVPSVTVTLFENDPSKSDPVVLGTWLVQENMPAQEFEFGGRKYSMQMRREREYLPYRITLHDFQHKKYLGTNTPKDFASEVTLTNDVTGETRDYRIYMNNPLRYGDLTFYQQGFLNDDRTSILQVVRNPGRHLPYISCSIISLGLLYQFGYGLGRFIDKRNKTA